MKVAEYRNSLSGLQFTNAEGRTLADTLTDSADIWNNDSCKGYCIKAMQAAGCDDETIRGVLRQFPDVFDIIGVDDAAQVCRKY